MTGWTGDLRYAVRTLMRSPSFTLVVTVTLALGIGANAAVFGLVRGALFTPPSFEAPDELLFVWNTIGDSRARFRVAAPDVAEVRDRVPSLAHVAFMDRVTDGAIEAEDGGSAEHVRLARVTPNFFGVLGVTSAYGRTFVEEAAASAGPTVLISDGIWRSGFGADPRVIGRTVRVDGLPATIVGVLSADFRIPMPPEVGIAADADVWIPLREPLTTMERADGRRLDEDSDNTGAVVARIRAGATTAQVREDLERLSAELRETLPAYATAGIGFEARPLVEDATRHVRDLLWTLMVSVGAVLVIMCLNLSTLLLARGTRKATELSVRAALGAGGVRIVRQLLAESAVLVALGTLCALLVAQVASTALEAWVPSGLIPPGGFSFDPITLVASAGVAALATGLAGVAPALSLVAGEGRGGLTRGIRRDQRREGKVRNTLVVAQIAVSVSLLLGAGMLVRTVSALKSVDPGFEPEGAMTFSLSVRTPGRYRGPGDRALLMRDIENRLSELPGVRAVGLTTRLPLSGKQWTQPYGLPGQAPSEWAENRADFRAVTSGYFEAMGMRVLEGRGFSSSEDLNEDRRIVVVDEALARRIGPPGTIAGRTVGIPLDGREVEAEIVGVVEHVRHEALDASGREALYVPYRQEASRDVSFVVRASGEPTRIAPRIRDAVADVDRQLPLYRLQPMLTYVERAVAPARLGYTVLTSFAFLAMLAVGIGLYGVVALEVGRRTRDFGIRMAVGATRTRVLRVVLSIGARLVLLGTIAGAALAVLGSGLLDAVAYGTSIGDPLLWAGAAGTVALVTGLACAVPALRASRLDPTMALRAE